MRLGVCDNMNYKFNFKIIKVSSGCYFGTQQMKIVGIEGACLLVLLVLKVQKFTPKNVLDIIFIFVSSTKHISISFVSVLFVLGH